MKKETALTILLGLGLLMIPSAIGTKADNTFRFSINDDPGSLNPLFSTSGVAHAVLISAIGYDGGVFDPLLDQSYEGFQKREFIPRIITSWEFKNKDSTIVYHLRDDVLWHDGEQLTAHDLKFTYDVITIPESGCVQNVEDFDTWVKDYRVIDDLTFEVDLKISDPYHFQSVSTTSGVNLLPYHYFREIPIDEVGFNDAFNQIPIGYGPYRVVDRSVNSYVTLEKFDGYWDEGYPIIDRIIYKIIPEVYPTWVAFKNGEIDMVGRSSQYLDDFNDYIKDGKMTTYDFPSNYFNGFRINFLNEDNPFQDRRVRQAAMYALDRGLLCEVVNENTSVPLKTIVTNRYPDRIIVENPIKTL
jgi:ABC-type dipeptide transport system, periplasmic component